MAPIFLITIQTRAVRSNVQCSIKYLELYISVCDFSISTLFYGDCVCIVIFTVCVKMNFYYFQLSTSKFEIKLNIVDSNFEFPDYFDVYLL